MICSFHSPLSHDVQEFLQFKRNLGYRYARAEFTLSAFDQFLQRYVEQRKTWQLDQAMLAWLASKPERKAVSVSMDAAVLRQFCLYLRRLPRHSRFREPLWPQLPVKSTFVPFVLSKKHILRLLELAAELDRPRFRACLYRALILVLYCTGVRFGEALRLRMCDMDIQEGVLFVETFKGRARWVPFHRSLSEEIDKYLSARRTFAPARPEDHVFVGVNRRTLPVSTAHETFRKLYQKAGLKPAQGRVGPRPYDLRHAFAIERLSQWYRQGMDLHARLPWLSAYMGHKDILGTETYLTATPELLELAGRRLRKRYRMASEERD